MQKLFLDFETHYDDIYSLKKMTPIEYVESPRFEALGCGRRIGVGVTAREPRSSHAVPDDLLAQYVCR